MARFKNLRKRNFKSQLQGRSGPVKVIMQLDPIEMPPPRKPATMPKRKSLPRNFPIRKDWR